MAFTKGTLLSTATPQATVCLFAQPAPPSDARRALSNAGKDGHWSDLGREGAEIGRGRFSLGRRHKRAQGRNVGNTPERGESVCAPNNEGPGKQRVPVS